MFKLLIFGNLTLFLCLDNWNVQDVQVSNKILYITMLDDNEFKIFVLCFGWSMLVATSVTCCIVSPGLIVQKND